METRPAPRLLLLGFACMLLAACGDGATPAAAVVPAPAPAPAAVPAAPSPAPAVVAADTTPDATGCTPGGFASDTFAAGSINGQNGWYVDPAAAFDESVVNLGAQAFRGKGVWRINNTVKSGGFGNQPQSPVLNPTAGESTVRTTGGGDTVCTSFYIRSVAAVADGSAFTFSHSPASADRHDYIRFENDDSARKGLRVWGLDTLGSTSAFNSRSFDAATLLPRATWMKVVIITTSPDGPGNDVVNIYLDGTLKVTMSTWEDWRFASGFSTLDVARALFRISTTGTDMDPVFTSPQGFYVDDFVQITYNSAAPKTILSQYKTGFELP